MKKSNRKLVICIETIRALADTELKRVAGAESFVGTGDPQTGINCPARALVVPTEKC